MQITDIKKTKRGRYSIYTDNDFYGVLHSDIYLQNPLSIGQLINSEHLDELINESQIIIAKERALNLLAARSYTSKALKEKLMRDVDETASDAIIARMQELGLIDDYDYARRLANDCINLKGFSHSRVFEKLYQKGISREIIEQTLADLPEENQEKLVYNQIKKKYLNKITDENDLRKTINALMRRGFRYNDISLVIRHLNEDINYYDNYWEE